MVLQIVAMFHSFCHRLLACCIMLQLSMGKVDWSIQKDSRIASSPRFLQPLLLLARNAITGIGSILPPYKFNEDGMATNHSTRFLNDQVFINAYLFACSNVPFDYGIRWRVHQAIWLALSSRKRFPDACFVELGTGRGFVMQSVLHAIEETLGKGAVPQTFLFDSFMPFNTDGISQQSYSLGTNVHYSSSKNETAENFSRWSTHVYLVEGSLPNSLKRLSANSVSFVHVDLNAAKVEAECLLELWEKIPVGGLILLDDYANAGFESTISPVRDFFIQKSQSVLSTPSGQGIVIKS